MYCRLKKTLLLMGILLLLTSLSVYAGGLLKLSSYKENYVGVPREVKDKLWFYRHDMFEAAGIDPEDVDTVDEFIAAGKTIQSIFPDT
jgi:ABC-type glycerol-3-phosphate transport system substrate-binding protein